MTHHLVGMAEIAEILGVSRQRVAQLIETYEDFPKPEVELSGGRVWSRTAVETWILSHPERGPGRPEAEVEPKRPRFFGRKSGVMFDRFTDRARASIVKAQEEARLLNHNYIGTEHLLLGLIDLGEGVAFDALDESNVTAAKIRGQIEEMIGRGSDVPEGPIPFTPRSTTVLELALREALELGHNYVGTEHVLLAIVREREGVAWQALARLGLTPKKARDAVLGRLQGLTAGKPRRRGFLSGGPKAVPRGEYAVCSFCGKAQADVEKLVAGPGIYICNECIDLCVEIISEDEKTKMAKERDVAARLERLERLVDGLRREDGES